MSMTAAEKTVRIHTRSTILQPAARGLEGACRVRIYIWADHMVGPRSVRATGGKQDDVM